MLEDILLPKKAPEGIEMLLDEALYPKSDAVSLLSLVELIAGLLKLEQITWERHHSSIDYA